MMLLPNAIALSSAQADLGNLLTVAASAKTVPLVVTILICAVVVIVSVLGSKRGHQD